MPDEDLNTGTAESAEVTSQESTPQVESPPINPVSDALAAFEAELSGVPTVKTEDATATEQPSTATTETPSVVTPPTLGRPKPQGPPRNYEGLDDEEKEWFANMRNNSYAALYPKWLEAKKLRAEHDKLVKEYEESRNAHLYEHEGAWTLAPEYNQLVTSANKWNTEVSYWEEQLEKIEAGEKWNLLRFDKEQGYFRDATEQEPTPQARAKVLSLLTQATTGRMQTNQMLSDFESNFKERHKGYVSRLSSLEEQIFGKEQLPKLAKLSGKKLEMFPSHIRGKPEVKMLANALVLIDALIAQAKSNASKTSVAAIKAKTTQSSGPVSAGQTGGPTKAGTVGEATDQFRKLLAGVA